MELEEMLFYDEVLKKNVDLKRELLRRAESDYKSYFIIHPNVVRDVEKDKIIIARLAFTKTPEFFKRLYHDVYLSGNKLRYDKKDTNSLDLISGYVNWKCINENPPIFLKALTDSGIEVIEKYKKVVKKE
jgi:hypothetical protein